ELAGVGPDASLEDVKRVSRDSGHLRLVVLDEHRPLGVVHVRDALTSPEGTTAADLMRPVPTLGAETPIYAALSIMRESRSHLALVEEVDAEPAAAPARGRPALVGLVTMQDMMDRLLLIESHA